MYIVLLVLPPSGQYACRIADVHLVQFTCIMCTDSVYLYLEEISVYHSVACTWGGGGGGAHYIKTIRQPC